MRLTGFWKLLFILIRKGDDVEIERLLLKEILCQYFEEINEEVSIVEYDSGETLIADVEEGYIAMDLLFLDICMK